MLKGELTKKKVIIPCKRITLYDIPGSSQNLAQTFLWLYLDWRSPQATCMSEQMGLINHLIACFLCTISFISAEKPYLCCIKGDWGSQNAIFQIKCIASSNCFVTLSFFILVLQPNLFLSSAIKATFLNSL